MANSNRNNNPSIGLKIWGPLVPASDCKKSLATLTAVQFAAGATLWFVPGRNPPATRSLSRNRLLKAAGLIAGTYLMFTAATEPARLLLPYDPWVEDAKKARMRENVFRKSKNKWSLDQLRYDWFGPKNYRPIPWSQWRERTMIYLTASEKLRSGFGKMEEAHKIMTAANAAIAEEVVHKIKTNEIEDPGINQADIEFLETFSDEFEDELQDENVKDAIEFRGENLWDAFGPHWESYVNIIARMTYVYTPGVEFHDDEPMKVQSVVYLPLVEEVKRR